VSSQRFSSRHLLADASLIGRSSRVSPIGGAVGPPVACLRVGAGPSIDDMDDALRKDFDLRIGAKPMNSRHPRIAVHRQRLITEWPK
jgi:hypothetical protein